MKTQLLIHLPDSNPTASSDTKFGGLPSAPGGALSWPVCKSCRSRMQFLGQLCCSETHELLLLFMCRKEPGECLQFEADSGSNEVLAVTAVDLKLVKAPRGRELVRPTRYGARSVTQESSDYDEARAAWASDHGVSPREVLGQLGGIPFWIQGEEIPSCDGCKKPMSFVAQLEQGPKYETDMNFGGGCAYVFRCTCAKGGAKMWWQC